MVTTDLDKPLALRGLQFERTFSQEGTHPYDLLEWQQRDALIVDAEGEAVFEQRGVEFPSDWSQTAVNVVASKYFRGKLGSPEREHSLKQLIDRVTHTVGEWGREGGYFETDAARALFEEELCALLVNQFASFNSPVWFNLGNEKSPQCSACFINSVEDTMESIMELAKTEAMLFKHGSGTGTNLSTLRSKNEHLSGGGTASGPVSFMKGYDSFAGVVKSGGKTRRAAKMVILDVDHPDIQEFVDCKKLEERKAWALIEQGYDGGFNVPGGAYDSVFFQNANHSVRVSDDFMEAVENDGPWVTKARTNGAPVESLQARELMQSIADSTWVCGDPGLQFDTEINRWHTCPKNGRINSSNPCSEFMFLDDTACNLASLNLLRFLDEDGEFDAEMFVGACEVVITAQEIMVGRASYPTPEIEANSHLFRPLGIGYANLGGLLMHHGLPYDSDEGRTWAGAITALLSAASYRQSARIAGLVGPFAAFEDNRSAFARVMDQHLHAVVGLQSSVVPEDQPEAGESLGSEALKRVIEAAKVGWMTIVDAAKDGPGVRNSQISVLAPTGTIGFMMDCDTTGIEPDTGLVKYKTLVGGGFLKIVNQTVEPALLRLGYEKSLVEEILSFLDTNGTMEGAPHLEERHQAVFDCAFKTRGSSRVLHFTGHLKMMSAVQPFLSGAISKTINMPKESTVEDILEAYVMAWRLGLKSVAIYRDGCKRSQPLSLDKEETKSAGEAKTTSSKLAEPSQGYTRRRLPDERQALTHKFSVNGHKGYITVGLYEDGLPGEIFLVMAKEGSTVSGLTDAFATAISIALQSGVPLRTLIDKFSHVRFEPSGFTSNKQIRMAKSIVDYIFRWLASKFLSVDEQKDLGILQLDGETGMPVSSATVNQAAQAATVVQTDPANVRGFINDQDAPSCQLCGAIMVRNGSCYRCNNCGSTSGCS